jgi:hypothetical protein
LDRLAFALLIYSKSYNEGMIVEVSVEVNQKGRLPAAFKLLI